MDEVERARHYVAIFIGAGEDWPRFAPVDGITRAHDGTVELSDGVMLQLRTAGPRPVWRILRHGRTVATYQGAARAVERRLSVPHRVAPIRGTARSDVMSLNHPDVRLGFVLRHGKAAPYVWHAYRADGERVDMTPHRTRGDAATAVGRHDSARDLVARRSGDAGAEPVALG